MDLNSSCCAKSDCTKPSPFLNNTLKLWHEGMSLCAHARFIISTASTGSLSGDWDTDGDGDDKDGGRIMYKTQHQNAISMQLLPCQDSINHTCTQMYAYTYRFITDSHIHICIDACIHEQEYITM